MFPKGRKNENASAITIFQRVHLLLEILVLVRK